jgi:hypothetical protein
MFYFKNINLFWNLYFIKERRNCYVFIFFHENKRISISIYLLTKFESTENFENICILYSIYKEIIILILLIINLFRINYLNLNTMLQQLFN